MKQSASQRPIETATRGLCSGDENAFGLNGESGWVRTMRLMTLRARFTAIFHHAATIFVTLCIAGLAVVVCYTVRNFNLTDDARELLWWYGAAWLIFATALVALRWVPLRAAVVLIVTGCVALGVVSLLQPPRTSSDAARYVWDGIVQQSGTSPYSYVPVDPELESKRTDWLFPAPMVSPEGAGKVSYDCPGWEPHLVWQGDTLVCTAINRPEVNTIYPGAAEGYFLLVALASPDAAQYLPLQIMGLLLATGVTVLLLWGLRRYHSDPRWAALWAWCPLVAVEAVNNAHIDALGALLILVSVLLIGGRRQLLGGVALGAAIAVKLLPVLLLPALIRRRPMRLLLGTVASFVAAYLPYVLVSGREVIGFLPGYLDEEGYSEAEGSRFALLRLLLPDSWEGIETLAAIVVLAITALLVLWRVNPDRPWTAAATMFGVALLVATPSYPWYALLLIPLAALAGRWEWLAVAVASTVVYLEGAMPDGGWDEPLAIAQLSYGAAGLIVAVATVVRFWLARSAPGVVAAGQVPERGEAALPQDRQGVGRSDAVLAVEHRGFRSAQWRNQLGYLFLSVVVLGAAVLGIVSMGVAALLRGRNDRAQRR